jgi:hypothetical protein
MTMVLHGLGLCDTMDTWCTAVGGLQNMLCVVSVCLFHDRGATWFRLV